MDLFSDSKKPLIYAIIIYTISVILLYTFKPELCFTKNEKVKCWGIGNDKTMFPIYLLASGISVMTLFVGSIYFSTNNIINIVQ